MGPVTADEFTSAMDGVTRVVLVNAEGVIVEAWADSWDVRVQDGGRTVKLFAQGGGSAAAQERAAALRADIAAIGEEVTPRSNS